MTKIDIISGFLGAGKTTLIRKLIAEAFPGEKLVLIENEFGEISIDGGFLADSGVTVSEMSSGCICCSLVGDFGTALRDVAERFHPDRILIEPSGVGKLSDVIAAAAEVAEESGQMTLNSFLTVADATKVKVYRKNFGEFYNDQISSAGTVVLSRTDRLTEEKLTAVSEMLHEINPGVTVITTPWSEIGGADILRAVEKNDMAADLIEELCRKDDEDGECCCHHHHHDGEGDHECHHHHDGEHHHHHGHDADEVFVSWGVETPKKFTRENLQHILSALDGGEYGVILRAKGIVPSDDGTWLHFDYVPEEASVRTGTADYTGRLCVIGSQLREDKLKTLFGV